jgi:tripartite-type tricarboxylate transporter receptor subunit TctC
MQARKGLERAIGCALAVMLNLMLVAESPAQANDYPARPIRLIVPYPPGATTDAQSRAVAAELGKVLGQSVIVENKPGAGTVIGTQTARNAPADGYTLLFQLSALATNLYAMKQPGYALSDFTPIGMLGQSSYILFASSKYPFHSVQDLVAYGKAHPNELNYSSTTSSVIGSRVKQALGLEWTEINYRGGAEATQAVMSGNVHLSILTQGAPLIHANLDKLRLLAVTGEKRLDFLPDVPTFKELGYPTMTDSTWFGIFVRSEVPQGMIDKLRATLADVIRSPAMQEQFKSLRISPYEGTLDDVPAKLQRELAEFAAEAKKLGLEPQ